MKLSRGCLFVCEQCGQLLGGGVLEEGGDLGGKMGRKAVGNGRGDELPDLCENSSKSRLLQKIDFGRRAVEVFWLQENTAYGNFWRSKVVVHPWRLPGRLPCEPGHTGQAGCLGS